MAFNHGRARWINARWNLRAHKNPGELAWSSACHMMPTAGTEPNSMRSHGAPCAARLKKGSGSCEQAGCYVLDGPRAACRFGGQEFRCDFAAEVRKKKNGRPGASRAQAG